MIPPILASRGAAGLWFAVVVTGVGTGLSAAALTGLLELTQHLIWGGGGLDLLEAASRAPAWKHLVVLTVAGVLTGAGQFLLTRLSKFSGIDITAAIRFQAGRPPKLRTLASATLSIVMELTGNARAGIVPLLLGVATATLVAHPIEPRSIYDARLSDARVREPQRTPDQGVVSN
jgi:H+/Cl- antiporter ClcA